MNLRFRSKVRDRCFSTSLVPAAAMRVGVSSAWALSSSPGFFLLCSKGNSLGTKLDGHQLENVGHVSFSLSREGGNPSWNEVGSSDPGSCQIYDALRTIRNAPRATTPSIFCSVFSISLIVTINFGSCFMICLARGMKLWVAILVYCF